MKNLKVTLSITLLFAIFSCSQQLNVSSSKASINESELLSFSCEKSFEHFLDLDSILNEIPDTLGYKLTATGDSVDWRLNTALGIQWGEWGKYYKNPTITSVRNEGKSSFVTVEFTGGGGYDFVGTIGANSDTLNLYYSLSGGRKEGRQKDTRYILLYEMRTKFIEGKEMSITYKD